MRCYRDVAVREGSNWALLEPSLTVGLVPRCGSVLSSTHYDTRIPACVLRPSSYSNPATSCDPCQQNRKMSAHLINEMQSDDWPFVRTIYLEGIATGNATFETKAPSWEEWDASHLGFARLVAREDNRIIGWAALSPVSRRKAYSGVAEVSVYVAHDSRG